MGNNQTQIDELKKRANQFENKLNEFTTEQKEAREKKEEENKQKEIDRKKQIAQQAEEEEKRRVQNITKLRAGIKQLKPGESFEFSDETIPFPKRLNIGLYGTTGVGKTSLLNSLKFAVNGYLKVHQIEQAAPVNYAGGGHTIRRMAVRITPYLTVVDNRGIGAESLVKISAADELIRQLEGRSSYASIVDWGKSSPTGDIGVDDAKKIYCTVLVLSSVGLAAVHAVVSKFVEYILRWQGRFPLAVITHVDEASPDQLDNIRLALMMAGIVDIYEVANVTATNKQLDPVYQENLLELLHKCIKDGDRIFEYRNEIELEQKKRETRNN